MSEKELFLQACRMANAKQPITKMVIAVKLPTNAIELIINTEDLLRKVDYYQQAYDDNMQLRTNPSIKIVGWLFV